MDKLTHLPLPLALTAGQVDIQPSSDWLVEAKQVYVCVCVHNFTGSKPVG